MGKKNFKSGLDDFFKENLDEIEDITGQEKTKDKKEATLNTDNQEVKQLLLKLQRYEEELKLWRTGKLTVEKFHSSLKEQGILYDADANKFVAEKTK